MPVLIMLILKFNCLIYLIICILFAFMLLFDAVIHVLLKLIEIICHMSINMLLETVFWYTVVKKSLLHHPVFMIYLCNVTKQGLWYLLLLFLFPYLMYVYTYMFVVWSAQWPFIHCINIFKNVYFVCEIVIHM